MSVKVNNHITVTLWDTEVGQVEISLAPGYHPEDGRLNLLMKTKQHNQNGEEEEASLFAQVRIAELKNAIKLIESATYRAPDLLPDATPVSNTRY